MSRHRLFTPVVFLCAARVFAASDVALDTWTFRKLGAYPTKPESVVVPHSWNAADITRKDYYRGPAVYYRDLGPGDTFAGKRVFLRCEGVSTVAEVAVGEAFVGRHLGGYTAFGFELTPFLTAKGPNRLQVRASNAWRGDVAPLSGDFSIAGGMHRGASLLVRDAICLDPVTDGARGVVVRYGRASKENAAATVAARVDNGSGKTAPVMLAYTLRDAAGAEVAKVERKLDAAPGASVVTAELSLANPHLWNGVKDPYRYTLEVALSSPGVETDRVALPVGFRDIRFDAKKGLFLNGEPLHLNGVNKHQDREETAIGMKPEQYEEDADILLELGANAVRLAHYPHSREMLEACDRRGILVWSEIPFVDTVGKPRHPDFLKNTENQLRESIRQNGYHPAVFCWSLFNELGMAETEDYLPDVTALNALAHAEDPSRPTVGATFHASKKLCDIPDIIAFNNYPGWYYKTPADMRDFVDQYAKAAPEKPWGVSEYGAGASVKHHELNITVKPKTGGDWHPEEWQCRVHEANYATLKDSALWGTFAWVLFDFATINKNEGDRHGINDKGLVTRDRKIRKDAFYFYQANWSDKPVLHLNSKRAETIADAEVPIRLYSNLKDIRVTFNGADLGAPKKYAPSAYTTDRVKLIEGRNTVRVTARSASGETIADELVWNHPAK